MKKYLLSVLVLLFNAQFGYAQADLIVVPGSLSVSPATIHVGITLDIKFSVQNTGNANSGITIGGLYLSVSTDPAAGVFLGNISLESLASGASSNTIECKFPIPYTIVNSGTYNLIVKLNPYQTVIESDYSNNAAFKPITIDAAPWAAQNLPYPIIFVHGTNSNDFTWDILIDSLKVFYGWSYGGRMDFCLNQDGSLLTSDLTNDYKDYTDELSLGKNDYYTVNFDVDIFGTPHDIDFSSNQSAIVKQGLAIRDAIKHVLTVTGRDKVILVCHSMGGLAAREYIQNMAIWKEPNINHHVAKLFTIGTPHGGTDATAFGVGPIDEKSEAVRDERSKYFSGKPCVYLFGGNENTTDIIEFGPTPFWNVDVNCNGKIGENIIGINNKTIRSDIAYSCAIGIGNSLLDNTSDGVVGKYEANINNYLPVNADTFIFKQPPLAVNIWHSKLTQQFKSIMKGIDESNSWITAYKVNSGVLYYGLMNEQSYGSSEVKDFDKYILNVPANGTINIQLFNIQLPQFTIQVYNSHKVSIGNIVYSNGKSYLNVDFPSLPKDNYYIVFSGNPSVNSLYYPYAFKLTYTAAISSSCSGITNLTNPTGNFSDGSGINNYNNNSDCKWKIQPSGATSITLNFSAFDVSDPNDTVYVYDGSTTNSPLIGKWTGASIPPNVTSTGGVMLVKFSTDAANVASGWAANYTAVLVPVYCNGTTTLASSSGSFSDGSGPTDYGNNTHCSWLINPPGSYSVTLNFTTFSTETANDIVNVYDGSDNTATLLGSFSGNIIPGPLTSSGGSLFVEFVTNSSVTSAGWNANFTSEIPDPVEGIVTYEYWFDNDYGNVFSTVVVPQMNFQLNADFPTDNLTTGLHSFHMRFLDHKDQWSAVSSGFFYKQNNTARKIKKYQYWIDTNTQDSITQNITETDHLGLVNSIDMSSIAKGLHTFHIRFANSNGSWSSVNSSFFYNNPSVQLNNKILKYRYWFDTAHTLMNTVTLTTPISPVEVLKDVCITDLLMGSHVFNIQFLDSSKNWSSVVTDTFYKASTSGSTITTNGPTTFCQGGNITLTASTCNNCTYDWSNGATTQSIIVTLPGNYFVKINYGSDCIQVSDTVKVTVNTPPSQPGIINGNISVITGQTLGYSIANVTGALGYSWSITGGGNITSGQNTNSINVNWLTQGNYVLSVKASNDCGFSNEQSLNISVSVPTTLANLDDHFQIRINPNPSSGDFYLKVNGAQNKRVSVNVFNLLGQEIVSMNQNASTNDFTQLLDLKHVVSGIYYVKIIINKRIYVRKIIKQD